jgi:hypothetical protein
MERRRGDLRRRFQFWPRSLHRLSQCPIWSDMTIVSYVHRRKKPPKKPARALAVPAIVTHKRRYGQMPPKESAVDPEADARLVEFFKGMELTYKP